MLWLLPALLLVPKPVVPRSAAAGQVVETKPGRVHIDWTAGRITAVGVGAPDLRAPGPAVARVTTERIARREAEKRLLEVAAALPLAAGGQASGARLDAARRLVHDLEVRYSSDGSVEVTLALPLEAVRQALETQSAAAPTMDEIAPTAVIVDLGKLDVAPALGVTLQAGGTRLIGPTVWHKDGKAAAEDPRAGARVLAARATAAKGGVITIETDEPKLGAAARAGALVVIVNHRWDGKR
jgi:hypothetical protein